MERNQIIWRTFFVVVVPWIKSVNKHNVANRNNILFQNNERMSQRMGSRSLFSFWQFPVLAVLTSLRMHCKNTRNNIFAFIWHYSYRKDYVLHIFHNFHSIWIAKVLSKLLINMSQWFKRDNKYKLFIAFNHSIVIYEWYTQSKWPAKNAKSIGIELWWHFSWISCARATN